MPPNLPERELLGLPEARMAAANTELCVLWRKCRKKLVSGIYPRVDFRLR